MKINRISPEKSNYLQILEHIDKSPKRLYFIGELPKTRIPSVAIVGTRRPSRYGIEVTTKLSYELAGRGIVVISGLALGVDAIAHRAALDAGGTTIAILANGLPDIRPKTNEQLGHTIVSHGGAIITEYEPGEGVRNYTLLERNRLVSGLADALIITEAATKSGTMSTAAHALRQGKDVFVVPGNITSPLSSGCNNLLKQGAMPATCADDIISVIAPEMLRPQTSLALGDTPDETRILELLQSGLRDGDEIQRQSGISAENFSTSLTMLELSGVIRALGGNQWTIK